MTTVKHVNEFIKEVLPDESKCLVSDGYHTFEELYNHRITLYIALARAKQATNYIWRSKVHSDAHVFPGWYLLGINKDLGKQITYHLPLSRWEETEFADTLIIAPMWDGHTPEDVLNRLKSL